MSKLCSYVCAFRKYLGEKMQQYDEFSSQIYYIDAISVDE